jgi:hypothetical protein
MGTKTDTPQEKEEHTELLSLIASLNELAVKELGDPDENNLLVAQQRLQKAKKMLVQQPSIDSNYRAIVDYNLAVSFQH